MSEVNKFTDHASMMDINGADQLFKALLSYPHFKNTISKLWKNALPVELKLKLDGDDRVCEPTSQDMEAMLCCGDSTFRGIILPCTIAEYDTERGRF